MDLERWRKFVRSLDCSPLFVTVSGADIYGFPSPDSDVDLRGCHMLLLEKVVGLKMPDETIDHSTIDEGTEVDLVSHEVGKYFRLLMKNNGYVLEQIFSPLVVTGQEFLDVLRPIATRCVTRHHYHHYRGFYATTRKLLEKQDVKKAKSLLYAYRVLMTGIHLMKSGLIETDVRVMYSDLGLDFIPDLIAAKREEKIELPNLDWKFHLQQLERLEQKLTESFEASSLPDGGDSTSVNELLVELRLQPERFGFSSNLS